MYTRSGRIAVLDGLRAMAIILVLLRHGVRPFWKDLSDPFLGNTFIDLASVMINGWIGVDLFFVLSGFLISDHLMGRYFNPENKHIDLKTYFKRRFLRIAPAYYAVLTLILIGAFPFYPYPESYDNWFTVYLYHLFFLQDYFPSDFNVVFWSLGVEIKFYFLAPFVIMGLLYMPSAKMRYICIIAMLASQLALRYFTAINNPEINNYELYFEDMRSIFHLSLDGLIMGMTAALICHDKPSYNFISKKLVSNISFFTGFIIFLFLAFMGPLVDLEVTLFDKVLQPSLISLSFGFILIGLLGECSASKIFRWGGFFPIALISYSLYLLHLPLMYGSEVICRLILISLGLDLDQFNEYIKLLLYWPVWLSITAGLSGISYLVFEKPFLFAKRKKE